MPCDGVCQTIEGISIHALREEGDNYVFCSWLAGKNFYPRPPRGGRLPALYESCLTLDISIHALREEGDRKVLLTMRQLFISIHALREEGDIRSLLYSLASVYFYPRPPRGGRRLDKQIPRCSVLFLSTPSARRATRAEQIWEEVPKISIHALREEGDGFLLPCLRKPGYFYPRPPRGGRLLTRYTRPE